MTNVSIDWIKQNVERLSVFGGQVNRRVPNGISIHFHDFFYTPLLQELEIMGIQVEDGKNQFDTREIRVD